jgi:integrase
VQAARELRDRTLKVFLDEQYGPWLVSHQKTGDATLARIRQAFAQFLALPLEDIGVRRVDRYRTDALSNGLSPATVNRSVNCLRGLMTRAVEWGVLNEHPLAGLKALKVDKNPKVRFLTESEEAALAAALEERDTKIKEARSRANAHRAARGNPLLPDLWGCAFGDRLTPMVTLSLKTGLRQGELFDLRWADVDFDAKLITVRGEDSKSGQTRYVR